MILLRISIISILVISTSLILTAQNCLDYGEFDDPVCFGLCGPSGWDASGTAYIVEGDTYDSGTYDCSYNVPESPTGGTYQTLWDSNTGTVPGEISTTIDGLTPGTEYAFGFWAATPSWICNGVMQGGGIILTVSIDGVAEQVPTSIGWDLYEYCVTATSSSIDISFTVEDTGLVGPAMIDDAFCSDLNVQCCELTLDAEPTPTICPFDDLLINLEYENESGAVSISWESDPPSGLAYLDLSDELNPLFNYNTNLSTGTQFTYTATVEDDLCELQIEVLVEVLPLPEISFDFDGQVFCSSDGEFIFPTTSASGISGEWDVSSVFLQDHPGELINVFFTSTDPDVDCPTTTEHFLEVQEEQFPSFDFPLTYCRAQHDIIFFAETSLENIEGSWSPSILELDLLTDGTYNIIFTPDDPFCISQTELEIEIYSGNLVEFDLPQLICASEDLYVFSTDNLNNIPGSWEFPSMDLSNASGELSNIFIPNTIDCYENYEYVFEVQDDIELSFNIPTSVCQTDQTLTLTANSNEGYQGQWSNNLLDPSNVVGDNFTSTWTPLAGQSDCLSDTTINVTILEAEQPQFDLPIEICSTEPIYIFPTTSNQGITGTWTTTMIDPTSGAMSIQSTFNPTVGQCAESFTVEIQILQAEVPSFNLPLQICLAEDPITLPTISDNSISGNWNMPIVDPSNTMGNTIALIFTPTSPCVEVFEWVIEVQQDVTPYFSFQEVLCWNAFDLNLPTISTNGIEGTWDIPVIIIEDNLGQTINANFTPSGECGEPVNVEFEIFDEFDVQLEAINPSDCNQEDGMIQITGQLDNLEFSIDGGLTWTEESTFDQLGSGVFDVWVSSTILDGCYENYMSSLEVLGAPNITSIISVDVESCEGQDGVIDILVNSQNDLEYSIDGGISWQDDPTFTNLDEGTYEIHVRPASSPECLSVTIATIEGFTQTEIISVTPTNISDCLEVDGSIAIEAIGEALEYSIDGGQNYSSGNIFENLPVGNYVVIVRSIFDITCSDMESISLTAPGTPTIISSLALPSSQCFPNSGSIIIEAEDSGDTLLFSIDGNDWQEENIFPNLSTGNYTIFVQDVSNLNCVTQDQVIVGELDDELATALITEINPTECNLSDGMISIAINESDVEFSNDAGVTWQEDSNFDNLSSGTYVIIIRKIGAPDCTSEFLISLDEPECPCNDLDVVIEILNNDCHSTESPSVQLVSVQGMEDNDITIQWNSGATGELNSIEEEGWQVATIFYDDGCEWKDSIYLEFIEDISFEIQTSNSDCPEANNGTLEVYNIAGGSGSYQISVSQGIDEYDDYNSLMAGEYSILVTDEQGCTATETIEIYADNEIVP